MRPDLDDVLSGIQRLLQNEIAPALAATPFRAEQARYVTILLEYCKKVWPRLHLALAEEHGDLCATLETVAALLASDGAGQTLGTRIRTEVDALTTDFTTTTLDVIAQRNRTLNDAVSGVVEFLDARDDGSPDAALVTTRAVVDAYLARQATRQQRELELLGLSW